MKKGVFILCVLGTIVSFGVLCVAQQQVPGRATPPPQRLIRIDPMTVQKLRATVNRATVLNTLMANSTTRGSLYSVAQQARVPVSELGTRGTNGKPAIGNPVVATLSLNCQDIDYNAGIKFSPFTRAPMCRNPKDGKTIPLGVFSEVGGAGLARGMTSLSELIQRNVLPLVTHESNLSSFVGFDVLLPDVAAPYLITVHVIPANNIPLNDLIRKFGLTLIHSIGGAGIGPGGGPLIQLAPLSGGSGFVGIITFRVNYAALYLFCKTSQEPLLFGGFTIMRL